MAPLTELYFLTSTNRNGTNIDNAITKAPVFLLGIDFKTPYCNKKYHSGTICNGVDIPAASNVLSGCVRVRTVQYNCNDNKLIITNNP